VVLLSGEWVNAWLEMSIALLVASLGVVGLGWWVLRGDRLNRVSEMKAEDAAQTEHDEAHPKSH
jgi:hypothetical protein